MKYIHLYIIILLSAFFIFSCKKEKEDANAKLQFSSSTICFDTVFTTVSSITKNFRVINAHDYDVKVDIYLANGRNSLFSINVDGVAGYQFKSVEIPAHDSIFVHVKVNIDPNDAHTPFLVCDSIIFKHGRTTQDVDLVAFGQNAHFIVANEGSGSLRYNIIAHEHEVTHWTNDLPYVIYGGYAAVDSLGTLIIDPGTKVYFHAGAGLWVYRYGNIQARGTTEEHIIFQGDKMGNWYSTDYSQWDRIWINEGTVDNHFEYVEITNAFIGLQIESLQEKLSNQTILDNCTIHNTHNIGLLSRAAAVTANNCQISNNGNYGMLLQIGEFRFTHLTIANYFSQSVRKTPTVMITNGYTTDQQVMYVGNTSCNFTNCIIYGMLENEIGFEKVQYDEASMTSTFDHCLLRCTQHPEIATNCIFNQPPLFINNSGQNYHLKSGSPAINQGKSGLNITTDIEGKTRDDLPDIGAFEFE